MLAPFIPLLITTWNLFLPKGRRVRSGQRRPTAALSRAVRFMAVVLLWTVTPTALAEPPLASQIMVATVHPLGTDAGVNAFRGGGNAVDAAVAAALTLGVVDNHNSGIGGGCFILIRTAVGEFVAIDGRETAPSAASPDMYVRDGRAQTELSQSGPLAVAVPGALAAYELALREYGKKSLVDLLLPAAELAEHGFRIDRIYAQKLSETADQIRRFPETARILLRADGNPYAAGQVLRQPDLARTYAMIAKHGVQWFYRGPFAQHVARWMGRNGGIITAMDFADYRPKPRDPLQSRYRGYSIIGFPPPSSGGIHVAQILNTLENFPFTQWRDKPHDRHHVLAEAMKLAFADRAYFLGDGDFVEVPRGLTDTTYARQLADQIRLDRVLDVATHGNPPQLSDSLLEGHTTHIAAADHFGNWVGITATVNTSFGSKIIVPGTGVVLNNEMDDFSIQPGVPNAFGLIGSQNNAIAPGKRPLSSMSPTIVLDPVGAPLFTLGAAGGPKIITQVAQVIVNRLDMLMDLEDAVAAPRLHHQWRPNQLFHEPGFSRGSIDHLKSLGHDLQESSSGGITQAIGRSTDGQLYGVFDPRVPGKASGY